VREGCRQNIERKPETKMFDKVSVVISNNRGGHLKAYTVDMAKEFPGHMDKGYDEIMRLAMAYAMRYAANSPLVGFPFDPAKHRIKVRFVQPDEALYNEA